MSARLALLACAAFVAVCCTACASAGQGTPGGAGPAKAGSGGRPDKTDIVVTDGKLISVSCASSAGCMAVGSYGKAATDIAAAASSVKPLADWWNGTGWQAELPPVPSGASKGSAQVTLTEVACVSAHACLAIGSDARGAASSPVVDSWDGTRWTADPVPVPAGATGTQLANLSCASATACEAVGAYTTQPGGSLTSSKPGLTPMAAYWNGTTWTVQTVPHQSGEVSGFLDGISCASAAACVAVGGTTNFTDPARPAEQATSATWTGTRWTTRPVAGPAGAVDTILIGLSCPAAADCTAYGVYTTTTYQVLPMVQTWNGSTWTERPAPAHTGLGVSLTGLSCATAISCIAIGQYRTTTSAPPLAASWDGRGWTDQSAQLSVTSSDPVTLTGISCASATACMAVGSTAAQTTSAAEWWNGRSWSAAKAPLP
jgi:hypothetical protein